MRPPPTAFADVTSVPCSLQHWFESLALNAQKMRPLPGAVRIRPQRIEIRQLSEAVTCEQRDMSQRSQARVPHPKRSSLEPRRPLAAPEIAPVQMPMSLMTEWLAWLDSVRGQPPAVSLANDAERVRIPTSDVIGRHLEERPMSFVELREARVRRGDIKMRELRKARSGHRDVPVPETCR